MHTQLWGPVSLSSLYPCPCLSTPHSTPLSQRPSTQGRHQMGIAAGASESPRQQLAFAEGPAPTRGEARKGRSLWGRSSQLGILPSRGHLHYLETVCGHKMRIGMGSVRPASSGWRPETLPHTGQPPTTEDYQAPNVKGAMVENPALGEAHTNRAHTISPQFHRVLPTTLITVSPTFVIKAEEDGGGTGVPSHPPPDSQLISFLLPVGRVHFCDFLPRTLLGT